jgi:hypothetical protein
LQTRAAALDWHEAVALVAELAGVMIASSATRMPSPSSVFIADDGTLEVRDGRTLSGLPVHQLAALLDSLLTSAHVPPELAQLIADHHAAQPGQLTVQDFARSLAYFEPPGRREIVRAIAEGAGASDSRARAEEELHRLTERARDAEDQPVRPRDALPRSRRRTVLIAGAAVALGAAGGGVFALFTALSNPGLVAGNVQAKVKAVVETGLQAVGITTPEVSAPPVPPSAPAHSTPHARRPRHVSRKPDAVQFTLEVKNLGGYVVAEAAPPDEPRVRDVPVDNAVYSADAEGIVPAVLIRPHLPSEPPSSVSADELGVLELVVGRTGLVDQVRLISPENRYQDRMIVAAAKTWRFQPATKDGAPVRSRVRIRVTL